VGAYIGSKIIQAMPCTEEEFRKIYPDAEEFRPGYKVFYPDGYVSWSPKHVFEEAYRLVSDGEKELVRSTEDPTEGE